MGCGKTYDVETLIRTIEDVLPDGSQTWPVVVDRYREAAQEEENRNPDDVKRCWTNTLCNKKEKQLGNPEQETKLIAFTDANSIDSKKDS
jgi:hypothetical protein